MNTTADESESLPTGIAALPTLSRAADIDTSMAVTKTFCANCATPLLGPHCYACGQPVKGMVRQLSSILSDVADTILNIDSRIFRTLLPLYFRPGYLTNEYFAGRRVRYVTPFRLYFFLSVAAFLLMQLSMDSFDLSHDVHVDFGNGTSIKRALTDPEVIAQRDAMIAAAKAVPGTKQSKLERAEKRFNDIADKRIAYLKSVQEAKANGQPVPADPNDGEGLMIGDGFWDPAKTPLHVDWLPDRANSKINEVAARMITSARRAESDPKPLLAGAFGAVPQVLFVLMPLFAILLKIMYIFKRRLYMEHLIVALHSHSFISISLLLMTLIGLLRGAVGGSAPWFGTVLGAVMIAMGCWLPIYLLLMQKRVYRQGWFFTLFKYSVIGICYLFLISFGIAAAFMVSLATT